MPGEGLRGVQRAARPAGRADQIAALKALIAQERARMASPAGVEAAVREAMEVAERQRAARQAPAVLDASEISPDGPPVPARVGPVQPAPTDDDLAAIAEAMRGSPTLVRTPLSFALAGRSGESAYVISALRAKAKQFQIDMAAGRPATPLTNAEAVVLLREGDTPGSIFGRQLTAPEYRQLMRDAERGEIISPSAVDAMTRSPDGRAVEQTWQAATPDQMDNLAASNFNIAAGGEANLTPNKAREPEVDKIVAAVRQYARPTSLESTSAAAVRELAARIASEYPPGSPARAELEQAFAGWSPDPDAPTLDPPDYAKRAMEAGRRDLSIVERMAADPNFTQENLASAAIRGAAEARAGGSGPRMAKSFVPEEPGLQAAVDRFNELPLDLRQDIARRLEKNSPLAELLAMEGGDISINPNAVASLTRPVNDASALVDEAARAAEVGDQQTVDSARALLLQAPADVRSAAIVHHRRRNAVEAALRQGLEAVSPTPQVAASPGPTALRPQGALTPEIAVGQPDAMPTAFDEAMVAADEGRRVREASSGVKPHRTRSQRLEAISRAIKRGVPMGDGIEFRKVSKQDGAFFKGGAERLEFRSQGSRLTDSNDARAITAARNAEATRAAKLLELEERSHEMTLAYLRTLEEPGVSAAAVDKAKKAMVAARSKWMATARRGDTATYVNNRGEAVDVDTLLAQYKQNFPTGNERSWMAQIEKDGWTPEAAGRKAWSDAKLNAASSERTYDDIVASILQSRPRAERNLNRSSDAISAADMASQNDDIIREALSGRLELDAALPEEMDDAAEAATGARRGRLGGGASASRREMGLQGATTGGLFGSHNPLQLKLNNKRLYANARQLAADVLNDTKQFHAGTENYEASLDRLTEILEDVYGDVSRNEGLGPESLLGTDAERAKRLARLRLGDSVTETDAAGPLRDPMSQDPDQVPTRIMQPEGHPAYELGNRPGVVEQLSPAQDAARLERQLEAFERARRAPGYAATKEAEVLEPRKDGPVTIDASDQPLAVQPRPARSARDLSQPETVLTQEQLDLLAENENAVAPEALAKAVGQLSAARRKAAAEQAQRALPKTAGGLPPQAGGTKQSPSAGAGDGLPAPASDLPPPSSGDASVDAKLDASATTIDAPADLPLAGKSIEDIENELRDELDDVVQQNFDLRADSGMSENDRWRDAQDAGSKWYRAERARRLAARASQQGSAPLPNTAGPIDPPGPADATAGKGGDNAPSNPAAEAADAGLPPPANSLDNAAADATAPRDQSADPPKDKDAKSQKDTTPTPRQEPAKRGWLSGRNIGVGVGLASGGLALLPKQKGGPVIVNLPGPPGQIPVGGPLPAGMDEADPEARQQAAIEQTLMRLRSGMSAPSGPYHTPQNYNLWR